MEDVGETFEFRGRAPGARTVHVSAFEEDRVESRHSFWHTLELKT
jgi:hypothetical protein